MYRMTGREQRVSYPPSPKPIQMRRKLSDRAEDVLRDVCERHGVDDFDVVGKSRLKEIVSARREFIAIMHFKHGYDHYQIANLLNLDRTSVLHHLGIRKASKVSYPHLRNLYR